jgi:hypothetical protein
LAELQRLDEGSTARLLLYVATEMVEDRYKIQREDVSLKKVLAKIDDLAAEKERIVETMQKNTLEFAAKLDSQKSESETKISFLIQQLKGAEERLKNSGIQLSKSTLSSSKDHTAIDEVHSLKEKSNLSSRPATATAAWASIVGNSSENSINLVPDQIKFTKKISPQNEESIINSNIQKSEQDEEMKRRWQAEKQRREQLEKRNMELAKELRTLKATIIPTS